MKIFKYLSPERIDVIDNQCIRFTQAKYLNDPFEHLPYVSKLLDEAYAQKINEEHLIPILNEIGDTKLTEDFIPEEYREAIPESIKQQISTYSIKEALRFIPGFHPSNLLQLFSLEQSETGVDYSSVLKNTWNERFGVLSLTKSYDNLTMWSHYAMNHEGFVIEFDSGNDFFKRNRGETDLVSKLQEVSYTSVRPKINLIDSSFTEGELIRHLIDNILFTKSKEWEYEEELRFIQQLSNSDNVKKFNEQEIHLFKFDSLAIKSVFLGVNIDEATKRQLLNIVDEDRYSHVNVFEGKLSQTEYKIDFLELKVK